MMEPALRAALTAMFSMGCRFWDMDGLSELERRVASRVGWGWFGAAAAGSGVEEPRAATVRIGGFLKER
jgi:hypothetical protein